MKFQNYWTNLNDFETKISRGEDQDLNITNVKIYCERLLQHVGRFRRECIHIFETIIEDMTCNNPKPNYIPVIEVPSEYKVFLPEEDLEQTDVYIENNIMFRIITCDIAPDSKWKSYEREFFSLDLFFDTLYVLCIDRFEQQIRVPLACMLDYKGFR